VSRCRNSHHARLIGWPKPVTPVVPAFAWHAHTVEECKVAAESENVELGLTTAEAEKRLAEHGPNALTPPERPSFLRKLWAQIRRAHWVLLAAAIISGAKQDWAEFGLILGVVIINVTIGMVQEGKAEKAADALNSMLAPRCTVARDGSRRRWMPASL